MSKRPLRIGLVTEGPTDRVVLEAIIPDLVGSDVVVTALHPDQQSLAFGGNRDGLGWRGVLGWCRNRGSGEFTLSSVMANLDILIVMLDGDVAREPEINCACPCPPADDTANALRGRMLQALGCQEAPPWLVLVVAMDAMEAWLLPVLRGIAGSECTPDPASQFKGGKPKLVEQSGRKRPDRYREVQGQIRANWSKALDLTQAHRFTMDLQAASERCLNPGDDIRQPR